MWKEGNMGTGMDIPEPTEEEKYGKGGKYKNTRKFAQITLARMEGKDYPLLNAENDKEREKKFIEAMKKFCKEFAVHGIGKKKESDLDGKTCVGLAEKAGFDVSDLIFSQKGRSDNEHKGRIVFDAGEEDGIVLADKQGKREGEEGVNHEELGLTAFLDHHGKNSKKGTCAAGFVYDRLVEFGLLKENEHYRRMIEFVRQVDSAKFPDGWNVEMYENSNKTFRGLQEYANFKNMLKFFEKNANSDVDRELTKDELEEYGFIYEKKDKNNLVIEKIDCTKLKRKNIKNSINELKLIEEGGFIIDSKRYGKIVIDMGDAKKGRKIDDDFEATLAFGADTYLGFNPEKGGFFLSSKKGINMEDAKKLTEKQDDLKLMRETMLFRSKNNGDDKELKLKLSEVLDILTDGKLEAKDKLKEYLDKEKEGKPEPEKAEEKKEPEKSEAEKITEEFGKKRARVLEAHRKLMEAQKNNAFDGAFLEIEFEKAEEDYKKFAGIYGKKMLEEKMKFLEEEKGLEKGTSDYEQSLASLKSEIFRSTVVGYNDQLFKQAFEKAKPKEKGIIGKLAGFFTKTKTRVVIFTAAALFFAPTATLAGAALLGSAKAFQKIYGKRLAGFKGRETEKMCKEFVSGLGRLESEKDWRDYIEYFSNEYYGKLLKFRKKNIFSMFLGNKDLTEGSSLDDKLKPEKKK